MDIRQKLKFGKLHSDFSTGWGDNTPSGARTPAEYPANADDTHFYVEATPNVKITVANHTTGRIVYNTQDLEHEKNKKHTAEVLINLSGRLLNSDVAPIHKGIMPSNHGFGVYRKDSGISAYAVAKKLHESKNSDQDSKQINLENLAEPTEQSSLTSSTEPNKHISGKRTKKFKSYSCTDTLPSSTTVDMASTEESIGRYSGYKNNYEETWGDCCKLFKTLITKNGTHITIAGLAILALGFLALALYFRFTLGSSNNSNCQTNNQLTNFQKDINHDGTSKTIDTIWNFVVNMYQAFLDGFDDPANKANEIGAKNYQKGWQDGVMWCNNTVANGTIPMTS